MTAVELFERATSTLKRLVLDYDLSDDEAQVLSAATDSINGVRGEYTERKLKELEHGDQSDHDFRICE